MNDHELAALEDRIPELAVAALNAAHRRMLAARVPYVVVIGDGLYRVSASGDRELIRRLPSGNGSRKADRPEAKG